MTFHQKEADLFIPDGTPVDTTLARVTHLGIGAHQDDLEFMAFDGIWEGYRNPHAAFCGVVCTDGRGSSRGGPHAGLSDEKIRLLRREEQRAAAVEGRYAAMIQLDYPSKALKSGEAAHLAADLSLILERTQPEVVYTHNPADKHPTHVAVCLATLESARSLEAKKHPKRVLGCEVWRGLDWLCDTEKVLLDESDGEALAQKLNSVFDSQISGGKRYDLAVMGRKRANATFLDPRTTDGSSSLAYAMDLTPLILDRSLDVANYVSECIERFKQEVLGNLRSWK